MWHARPAFKPTHKRHWWRGITPTGQAGFQTGTSGQSPLVAGIELEVMNVVRITVA